MQPLDGDGRAVGHQPSIFTFGRGMFFAVR
jgi:hypothetical protein